MLYHGFVNSRHQIASCQHLTDQYMNIPICDIDFNIQIIKEKSKKKKKIIFMTTKTYTHIITILKYYVL